MAASLIGFLYIVDEEGNEIPGSRRSLAHVERGTGGFRALRYELKRLAGEGCEVVYSED